MVIFSPKERPLVLGEAKAPLKFTKFLKSTPPPYLGPVVADHPVLPAGRASKRRGHRRRSRVPTGDIPGDNPGVIVFGLIPVGWGPRTMKISRTELPIDVTRMK